MLNGAASKDAGSSKMDLLSLVHSGNSGNDITNVKI
jgi:hypothetical protein